MRAHGPPLVAVMLLASSLAAPRLAAQQQPAARSACDFHEIHGAVWWGTESQMPVRRLAAYMAPVLWFSPDEPLLRKARGAAIRMPEPFPGEPIPDAPVMYYQLDALSRWPSEQGSTVERVAGSPGESVIDLGKVVTLTLHFYAYFSSEEGLGAHPHDIEPVEFRAAIVPFAEPALAEKMSARPDCPAGTRVLIVRRVSGKAHGLEWFWNVIEVDDDTFFPMHLLVEEGKHAFATDKNGDGVFTPGYDVNVRINDAWGVRDIIRTGYLFSGGFQSWQAKVRRPEHRVLPPLPEDSPLRIDLAERVNNEELATYELRPFPDGSAYAGDPELAKLFRGKAVPDWPEELSPTSLKHVASDLDAGAAIKSISVALRLDGDVGVSFVFPLLLVKHVNEPFGGGYLLNRLYFKDEKLREGGWQLLYTPSASRWIDPYFGAGVEWNDYSEETGVEGLTHDFAFETGFKFRVQVEHSPLRFLKALTPYWGVRVGIKNLGFWDINRLTYVVEFGAGSF